MAGLLTAMEKLVRLVARCRILEALYSKSSINSTAAPGSTGPTSTIQQGAPELMEAAVINLQKSLMSVYAGIMRCLVQSYDLYSKKSISRAMRALFDPGQTANMSSTLARLEIDLSTEVEVCENLRRSVVDENILEKQERLVKLLKRFDFLEPWSKTVDERVTRILGHLESRQHLELLDWISDVPYGKYHDEISGARAGGTCDWLLSHERYREWASSDTVPLLWVQGIREHSST